MDEKSIEAAAIAIARVDLPRSFASLKGKRLDEAAKIEANWQPYMEHARAAIAAYRDAEIERLTAERETLKTARDFTSDEREGWEAFLREFFEAGEISAENSALRAKLEAAGRMMQEAATALLPDTMDVTKAYNILCRPIKAARGGERG